MIEVLDGGMQTTIQDGGRPGYLSRGIPPAGAQDFYSLALANILVGNELTPPPLVPNSSGGRRPRDADEGRAAEIPHGYGHCARGR